MNIPESCRVFWVGGIVPTASVNLFSTIRRRIVLVKGNPF